MANDPLNLLIFFNEIFFLVDFAEYLNLIVEKCKYLDIPVLQSTNCIN